MKLRFFPKQTQVILKIMSDSTKHKSSPNSDILKALDEVEQKSAVINERKRVTEERIKKHIRPVKEIDQDTKVKMKVEEMKLKGTYDLKKKAIIGICLFTLTWIITMSLTKKQKFTMVENLIIVMCVLGMAASKRSK